MRGTTPGTQNVVFLIREISIPGKRISGPPESWCIFCVTQSMSLVHVTCGAIWLSCTMDESWVEPCLFSGWGEELGDCLLCGEGNGEVPLPDHKECRHCTSGGCPAGSFRPGHLHTKCCVLSWAFLMQFLSAPLCLGDHTLRVSFLKAISQGQHVLGISEGARLSPYGPAWLPR